MSDFRTMRRKRRQLSENESISILQQATAGTLALVGSTGGQTPCEQGQVFDPKPGSCTCPYDPRRVGRQHRTGNDVAARRVLASGGSDD